LGEVNAKKNIPKLFLEISQKKMEKVTPKTITIDFGPSCKQVPYHFYRRFGVIWMFDVPGDNFDLSGKNML